MIEFNYFSKTSEFPTFDVYDLNWKVAEDAINGGNTSVDDKDAGFEVNSSVNTYNCDTRVASIPVTLPPAATENRGHKYTFIKTDAANTVTFSENISGVSKTLTTNLEALTIISNGSNWVEI